VERSLRKFRQTLSLLPGRTGENVVSLGSGRGFLRPLTLITGGIILLVIIAGGYLLWHQRPPSSGPASIEVTASPAPPPSPPLPQTVTEDKKPEKIESLFENIKQANLQENIDLFMSCFSRDFNGTEEKRKDTLKMWQHFNYLDLSYDLKKQTISGDTADVRLEWLVRTSEQSGGTPRDGKTVLDVTLKREDGHWKIRKIKPAS
jgi:ketosteroid isomerase-like protein